MAQPPRLGFVNPATETDVDVRRLTLAEAGEALTVQRAAFVSEGRVYNSFDIPPLAETLDELEAAWATHIAIGAFAGSRLVGSTRVGLDGSVGWISRVAVAPDQQGRGIGRRLVREAMALAPAEATTFRLAAAAGSHANLRLYESIGFVEVDRSVDVAGIDMIIMEARR